MASEGSLLMGGVFFFVKVFFLDQSASCLSGGDQSAPGSSLDFSVPECVGDSMRTEAWEGEAGSGRNGL